MKMYCTNCLMKTESKDLEIITTKDSKSVIKCFCIECNCKKVMLLGKHGGDFVNFINTLIPGEKHLPGMSFCGPGTDLSKRLNEDLIPKDWSNPIDRVDAAAYKHDIKYIDKSKEARHIADVEMIEELNNIQNPTFRERVERSIVIPILKTKKFLGLGIFPSELIYLLNEK